MAKQINKNIPRTKRPIASTNKIIMRHKSQITKPHKTKPGVKQTRQVSIITVPRPAMPIVTEPTIPQIILRSDGLVKRYKKRAVVDEVSIQVKQGEIVGLLGAKWRWQDDNILYDCWNDSAKRR